MANEEDYFIAANSVGAINEEQYKKLDVLIHTTEAISRSLYQSVYLIDYYKKGFLYVSENPLFLCGHTAKEMKEMGYAFYGSPDKLGGKILNFPEKVIPLCHE